MLARKENFVELDPGSRRQMGNSGADDSLLPLRQRPASLRKTYFARVQELMHAAGGEIVDSKPQIGVPGSLIHEVGTSRMGNNPKNSVLNSFCQTHDVPNLFVFGGGCFVTTGDKHPTLTMMALTARGCDRLKDLARKREL